MGYCGVLECVCVLFYMLIMPSCLLEMSGLNVSIRATILARWLDDNYEDNFP